MIPFGTTRLGSLLIYILLLTATPCLSQGTDEADLDNIRTILLLLTQQSQQIQNELDEAMKDPLTPAVSQKRLDLQGELDQISKNFESLATKLNTEDLILGEETKQDWSKELQDLTSPLLQAMRDFTKKPRKIEKLRKQIDHFEIQLAKYKDAFNKINTLMERQSKVAQQRPEDLILVSRLYDLKKKYDPKLIQLKLEDAHQNLDNELADKKSLLDLATDNIKSFFKHRGRNLLITVAAVFSLWWALIRLRVWAVGKRNIFNLNARTRKILLAAYNLVAIILCVTTSLVSLYLLNDWLLLSVIIIVLVAIAWTSRQLVPRFFLEVQMALNMGTVREGERLVWNGVPWLVKNLGLDATLVNKHLEEKIIHLPLKELMGKHSRPVVDDEPWFPTATDDWVIMADKTYGKVKHQTQEQVVLLLKGDTLKFYSTAEFLKQAPMNISRGFRYNITFGLDYSAQNRICKDIPGIFEEGLRRLLSGHFQSDSPDFTNMKVQFDNAGANSLELAILLDVDGNCAEKYEDYKREINSALVQVCNENNLVIPFKQLTVNFSADSAKTAGKILDKSSERRV